MEVSGTDDDDGELGLDGQNDGVKWAGIGN
ncbi:uncharacterized protein G2W53_017569 [Senna tora]|uniref:Uncharacterized protein n=1 Tax=Senna tora TaxID=362788 RepID=A0A834TUC3_9FABA|nr:uncharacterized protein G2W53_017569 [Senna tora]